MRGEDTMAETVNLNVPIDRDLKERAEQFFNKMGVSYTSALIVFTEQAVRQGNKHIEIDLDDNEVSLREAIAITESIRQDSVRNGTDKMTMEEIDAEIAAARAERKMRGISQ